ncbi:MAG: hypothetical protein V2A76_13210 [Planctomycetota bacterium]
MSGRKKHPLEVFKASGRSLGGQRAEDDPSSGAKAQDDRERLGLPRQNPVRTGAPEREARPPSEFELRLTLPGALVLLFAWVVLMGAAYIYGHSRGRGGMVQERDQTALALGRQIEETPSSAKPAKSDGEVGIPAKPWPYGVLLVTYTSYQKDRIQEISNLLREKYGIKAEIFPYIHDRGKGKVELFVGVFDKADDPELKKLAANVRNIQDWPSGRDKTPFQDSYIRQHPRIPDVAAPAERPGED